MSTDQDAPNRPITPAPNKVDKDSLAKSIEEKKKATEQQTVIKK